MSAACPACPWAGVPIGEQRARKEARLRAALGRFGAVPTVRPIEGRPPEDGYRTRAKLVVAAGPRLGIYAEGSHDVVDLAGCTVLAPALDRAAAAIRGLLSAPGAAGPVLGAREAGGALLAVDLREAVDGEARVLLTLVLDRARAVGAPALAAAVDLLRAAIPALGTVAVSLREARSVQLLGPETRVLWGEPALRDRVADGVPYALAAPGSFSQPHRAVAAAIHEELLARIPERARVVELFAGSGALALRLAARGARVLAVESFGPAIVLCRRAADEQRIEGLEIRASDAADMPEAPGAFVVLDPPRRGTTPEQREAIARARPGGVLYVSCDPDTLARDLSHLGRLGLRAAEILPFDMIPRTPHVEALAVLAPAEPPSPRVLFEDGHLVAVDKDPHEPTTPQGEHARSLLDRVRGLPGAERAVPVHRLDAGTSGVCLFARQPEHVEALAAQLSAGKKSYAALVRGVTHKKGIVRRPLREEGRQLEATTRFTRRAVVGGHSLLRASPAEGRTHQIRRHLASLGHPILGDARHGHAPSNRHLFERAALDRPFLHCERIVLGSGLVLEAPLAPDLALVLERLGGGGGVPDPG